MILISHRGYIKKYKENTFEGIMYALELPFIDGVEFDVKITKDKKFVLIHDFFIDRVSDGSGLINKMSYKKLLKYNFGTKKNPSKITTLKEILNINSDKIFIMELKLRDSEYFKVKNKLIKLLSKYKDKRLYICSFNETIINDLKKCNLPFKYGIIFTKFFNNKKYDFYLINHIFFNDKIYIKLKNEEIFLWTLNNKNDINKIEYNKDNFGIISDYPKLFK